jgi:subtilisin
MDSIRSLPTDETTGRSLVLFEDGAAAAGIEALQEATGLEVAPARARGQYFETLGVAVVDVPPDRLAQAEASTAIIAVEPERVVRALEVTPGPIEEAAPAAADETEATWGLQATNVIDSSRTGRGIRVAVLDTGIDRLHPDFEGRPITAESFISGEEVQDGHGHGTHCIGTALGPRDPEVKPRYGIAHEAEIFAGKVLSNAGSGGDAGILAAIEWAIRNGCAVVSMSLGAATRPGQSFSQVFERVAQRAQEQCTLIVAAAGNESDRPEVINPVGHPANCPSIMAVAALDVEGAIAPFSNRAINPDGSEVDIAGPGVAVYSTWPMPTRYRTISGTSMATPHVAGIAALYAEQDPTARGAALWELLTAGAEQLALAAEDVGAGMVQAP